MKSRGAADAKSAWGALQEAVLVARRLGQTLPCDEFGELWFDEDHHTRSVAARACAGCTLRQDCLEYAGIAGEEFGVWGGRDFSAHDPTLTLGEVGEILGVSAATVARLVADGDLQAVAKRTKSGTVRPADLEDYLLDAQCDPAEFDDLAR